MKRPKVQASAHSTLTASAAVPNSGFTFVDNAQGASAAVAELSTSIDVALDQVDLEGDLSGQVQTQFERLDSEAAKYSNSCLSDDGKYERWECSLEEAQVVAVAWECAAAAYDPVHTFTHDAYDFQPDLIIEPSLGGSIKAAIVTTVTEKPASTPPHLNNPFFPLLCISIRGSKNKVDHMVNANNNPRGTRVRVGDSNMSFEAHSGFLNSAETLDLHITETLPDLWAGAKHVLFTGHSAGGGVASLMYLKYLSGKDSKSNMSRRLSCITFGSPPVIRPTLTPGIRKKLSEENLLLNIINEFDLVTRSDRPYVLSLVDLYRSIHQLPPISHVSLPKVNGKSDLEDSVLMSQSAIGDAGHDYWTLPSAFYHHVGKRVVLQLQVCHRVIAGNSEQEEELELKAKVVPEEQFEKLLFCRIGVHRRSCYGERIKALAGAMSRGNLAQNTPENNSLLVRIEPKRSSGSALPVTSNGQNQHT